MKVSNVFNWITGFLTDPKKRQFLIMAIAVIAIMFWFRSCQKQSEMEDLAKREKAISEQNVRALTDSLRFVKNKAGEIEAVKSSFVTKIEDLEKLNKDLYLETKKEIGNLKSLIKTGLTADGGGFTVSNDLIKYPDNKTFGLKFENTKADTGMTWTVKGESKFMLDNNNLFPGSTTITENKLKMKLVMGFKENKDGNYEVFARSGSPNITFNDLDGVLLIPKKPDITCPPPARKKKFGLGLSLGYGISTRPNAPFVGIGPYIGVGLNYNLIEF